MLVSKDENIKTSAVYVGSLVLQQLKKTKKDEITIFEIAENLQKKNIISYRHIVFALMFLHSCNIIDFKEPYIYKI
ncbi:MAG: hypothetical protein GXO80_03970 [Chlorobi bacterium]|nr:hypothetical protein [Chlorobiota bacterium]